MTEDEKAIAAWLLTRPECVQRLAAEFPPGSRMLVHDRVMYVMGWTESDSLIVSPVWPGTNYEEAMASKEYVCAKHYRPCKENL